jgi:hypothetical protein
MISIKSKKKKKKEKKKRIKKKGISQSYERENVLSKRILFIYLFFTQRAKQLFTLFSCWNTFYGKK